MAVISFHNQVILARDDDFRIKLQQATLTVAGEVLTDPATASDETTSRINLATRAINSNTQTVDRLAYVMATFSPYEAGSPQITDELMLAFVRQHWTMLSGYNPNITPAPEE